MTLLPRPQRLFPLAAPGSMLKRAGGAVTQPREVRTDKAADYLAGIRACPCLRCGMEPSEAAHVRYASAAFGKASGLQKKPDDRWALPLCAQDHRLARDAQHNRNEREFWESFDIDPLPLCVKLWEKHGDLVAMRAVVMVAIAGRKR